MTLALIAGSGALPVAIAGATKASVWALETTETPLDARRFRVETLGTLIATLKGEGVTEVCFAGAVTRPAVDPTAIDAATLPLVPRLMAAVQTRGDDATLRALLGLFEEQGFTIRAAHELVPELLPAPGVLAGDLTPDIERDAVRATEVMELLAPADLGQSCVVKGGQVVAVEAVLGTDWMLGSLQGEVARDGVFFKAPKVGQDRRIDLPAIGPNTVRLAVEAGLAALVVEAGGVMVLDANETADAARQAGITLWVRS